MKYELVCYMLLLFLLNLCNAKPKAEYIYNFVYGNSVPGEQLTYYYRGSIPDLVPIYTHVIDPTQFKPHLETNFTLLKVEYVSPVSKVEVEYLPAIYTLKFTIVVPLVQIEFAVAAFALKKKSRRRSKPRLTVVYIKK